MIRANFTIVIDKPKWWHRMFTCKHDVVSVTENPCTRFGVQTSYHYCMKCGRKAMDITNNCDHKPDAFGECFYCYDRILHHDCEHPDYANEPDTDLYYCTTCGEFRNDHGF